MRIHIKKVLRGVKAQILIPLRRYGVSLNEVNMQEEPFKYLTTESGEWANFSQPNIRLVDV